MPTMNPEQPMKPLKVFNAQKLDMFISTDPVDSESVGFPVISNPLGYSDRKLNTERWEFRDGSVSTAGILTFKLNPNMASGGADTQRAVYNEVWRSMWRKLRYKNPNAEKYQPADIQAYAFVAEWCYTMIELLKHIATLGRTTLKPGNLFMDAKPLLMSIGVAADSVIQQASASGGDWLRSINYRIARFNNSKSIKALLYHGRWANLLTHFYKDSASISNRSQFYAFRLEQLPQIEEDSKTKTPILTYVEWDGSVSQLETHIDAFLNFLQYDSSMIMLAQDLENSQVANAYGSFITIEPIDPSIAFIPEIDIAYDFNVLLAIHNATVEHGVYPGELKQDPSTGFYTGNLMLESEDPTSRKFEAMRYVPKVINMPIMNPTTEEWFNATQWTFTTEGATADSVFVGPDFLSKPMIVIRHPSGNFGIIEVHQFDFSRSFDWKQTRPEESYAWIAKHEWTNGLFSQFAYAPIKYSIYYDITHGKVMVDAVKAELECCGLFTADQNYTAKLQYNRNVNGVKLKDENVLSSQGNWKGLPE